MYKVLAEVVKADAVTLYSLQIVPGSLSLVSPSGINTLHSVVVSFSRAVLKVAKMQSHRYLIFQSFLSRF